MRPIFNRSLPWVALALLLNLSLPAEAERPSTATRSDGAPAEADLPSTFAEALAAGKTIVSLRYRFETVDQDGIDDAADASTLRTTLSYGSGTFKGLRFFVEAENVTAIPDDDNYNNAGSGSLNNGVRDRPVVADPELTDINQVYLEYTVNKTALRIGRQEVNLGNQRFVGSVGWRQHHQSFNAFSITDHSFGKAKISYHYLDEAHRIFGDSREMNSHLLHAEMGIGKQDRLTAYGYLLDYDVSAGSLILSSTSTYGLRWAGHRDLDSAKISYNLEAALQQDVGDNPRNVDAQYLLAELSAGTKAFTGKVGYEVLSGSVDDGAFSTPLATLHKFNGWADKFLRTPTDGLVDLYASIGGSVNKFKWSVIYHDFQPESDRRGFSVPDYGTELDLLATYKTDQGLLFGLKAAFYDADGFSRDTDKIMFWSAYRFGR